MDGQAAWIPKWKEKLDLKLECLTLVLRIAHIWKKISGWAVAHHLRNLITFFPSRIHVLLSCWLLPSETKTNGSSSNSQFWVVLFLEVSRFFPKFVKSEPPRDRLYCSVRGADAWLQRMSPFLERCTPSWDFLKANLPCSSTDTQCFMTVEKRWLDVRLQFDVSSGQRATKKHCDVEG